MNKLIFLSHIHEERDLAKLLKEAIEDEFSGFVEVFVSSVGNSIPTGTNFLRQIERGLLDAAGALYLISPTSVVRPWINFELGAVWMRGLLNERTGLSHVPTIPVCHSGMTLSSLPMPISQLNGIQANHPGQLESAFRNLQIAMTGKTSALRTDFPSLAAKIAAFERQYTLTANLKRILEIMGSSNRWADLTAHARALSDEWVTIEFGHTPQPKIEEIMDLIATSLSDVAQHHVEAPALAFGPTGAVSGATLSVAIRRTALLE